MWTCVMPTRLPLRMRQPQRTARKAFAPSQKNANPSSGTGEPRDLTLVHALGLGDRGDLGTNRFAHEGMIRKIIASHFTWSAKMQQLIREEKIEAYCFPGGVIQQLLREICAVRPGPITHSGLGTFVDPRQDGGRCNRRSQENLVELMSIDGREVLRYRSEEHTSELQSRQY